MQLRKHLSLSVFVATLLASFPAPVAARAERNGSCTPTKAGYSCTYGPFEVSGAGEDTLLWVAAPPEPGYITTARAMVVDGSGVPVPRHAVHLHHAVWTDPTRSDMTWPKLPAGNRFFGAGKERTKMVLPAGHGYRWSAASPASPYLPNEPGWGMAVHLDGMHEGFTMNVYVRLNLGFVPDGAAAGMTPINTVWLDVMNGPNPVYDVVKGSGANDVHRKRWTYDMPTGGRFVALAGHLHDGGIKLVLGNVTRGTRVFASQASYRKSDRLRRDLRKMSSTMRHPGTKVRAGDTLRLTAHYDSRLPRSRVMGIMMAALVEPPPAPRSVVR